ncbi:MAG: elongation factor P [Pseudobdellovibrionaceae bacterium]|nr:elongation factor P [Bdellovibrionales bacterium]USN48780.1 MAG: elongation factor P [Pseudobdellovibrionaceae bacterium]
MHSTSDFKKGLKLLIDSEPYTIVDFQHVKPGKGNQFTRTKLKNLITGSNLERTFKSGEKFEVPDVVYRDMDYLYSDDSGFHFMDQSNYEQLTLSAEVVADGAHFLTENLTTKICLFNDRAVGVELPNSVQLKVVQTDPGLKGNTVSNTTKPATLETGHVVQVPLHTNEGDVLKVDTRTGEYMERVSTGK